MQLTTTTKNKLSKSAGECDPQTPRSSRVPAIVVKTEPVDSDEGHPESLSSPIVISSSENEEFTPKAKFAKGKNFPSSLTEQDFIRARKGRPTPRGKGKETAAYIEEPVLNLPSSEQPLSETTVYLEDM